MYERVTLSKIPLLNNRWKGSVFLTFIRNNKMFKVVLAFSLHNTDLGQKYWKLLIQNVSKRLRAEVKE